MKLYLLFTCYLLTLTTVFGDFLNEYLDDKTFGANPGPCPFDDGSCKLNLNTDALPLSIASIEFCITVTFIEVCDELQNWVKSGEAEMFNVECKDLGVEDITLEEISSNQNSVINNLSVEGIIQRCSGSARFTNVELSASFINIVVSVDADFETNPNRRGLDIDFDFILSTDDDFSSNLVNNIEIFNCNLDLELGLSLENTDFSNLELSLFDNNNGINIPILFFDNFIANILVTLVEALFGQSICGVIEQAGTLNGGELGILNLILKDLNQKYVEIKKPTFIDISQQDADFLQNPQLFGSSQEEIEKSLNLRDSNFVELISVSLNDFLGDQSVQPLRINQAINLLTEPNGKAIFDFTTFNIPIEIPINVANVSIALETLSLEDLSTISIHFQSILNQSAT